MKKMFISALACIVLLFALSFSADAGTKTLTFHWNQVISTDFGGWRLFKSTTPNVVESAGNLMATIPYSGTPSTAYTAAQPLVSPDGQTVTYYFVLTAFDLSGNESVKSNEVSATIDFLSPTAPSGLTVSVTVGP